MQNRELFLGQGGEAFDYVPCLNSSAAHVDVMEDVVLPARGRLARTRRRAPRRRGPRRAARTRTGPRRAALTAHSVRPLMPLGRFLEVSLAATDVAESLAFYESLGFVQASVGETWPHPYAVVTDGRLSLGLHGLDFDSPLPTWVAPVAARATRHARRARHDHRGRATRRSLAAPGAVARSLGPAAAAARGAHVLAARAVAGAFDAPRLFRGIRASRRPDLAAASAFWERARVRRLRAGRASRSPKVVASQPRPQRRALRHRPAGAGAGRSPTPTMPERIAQLRDRGHRFAQRLPRELTRDGRGDARGAGRARCCCCSRTRRRADRAGRRRPRSRSGSRACRRPGSHRRRPRTASCRSRSGSSRNSPRAITPSAVALDDDRNLLLALDPFQRHRDTHDGLRPGAGRRRRAQCDGGEMLRRRAPRPAACCGACRPARRPAPAQRTPGRPRRAPAGRSTSKRSTGSVSSNDESAGVAAEPDGASLVRRRDHVVVAQPGERAGPADDDGDDGPLRVDLQRCACRHAVVVAAEPADCDCGHSRRARGAVGRTATGQDRERRTNGASACACRVLAARLLPWTDHPTGSRSMPLRNTAEAYGSLAKFLHWAIVLLIVPQYFLAEAADELPDGIEKLQTHDLAQVARHAGAAAGPRAHRLEGHEPRPARPHRRTVAAQGRGGRPRPALPADPRRSRFPAGPCRRPPITR